jgi:hypothetical protein
MHLATDAFGVDNEVNVALKEGADDSKGNGNSPRIQDLFKVFQKQFFLPFVILMSTSDRTINIP